jgi:DNA gyrase subunit A
LQPFVEPSTRSGRKYARPKEGVSMLGVEIASGSETVIAVSEQRRALLCATEEINYLSGAGRGVMLMKLADSDKLIGFRLVSGNSDAIEVKTARGGSQRISTGKYEVTSRGGKGREVIKTGQFTEVVPRPIEAPAAFAEDGAEA